MQADHVRTEAVVASAAAAPRGNGLSNFASHPTTLKILSAIIVFAAWEYAGRAPVSPVFPTFIETMAAMWEMLLDGSLIRALAITLEPLAIGLIVSALAGVAIGIAMGLSRLTEWFTAPIFVVLQASPMAAIIPMLVFAYGIGLASKVLTVCIMAMPVIVLNAYGAVRHAPQSLVEMARSFQGSQAQVIGKVILPAASPVIFAGLRLGAAAGFIGAVLAELLITPTGIGDLISYHSSVANYASMYAAILAIIVFAVVCVDRLELLEARLFRPDKRAQR